MFQHGRSDSYRVATISATQDDNKTADGRDKVHFFTHWRAVGAINFPFLSLSVYPPVCLWKYVQFIIASNAVHLTYGCGKMGVMKPSTIAFISMSVNCSLD